MRERGGGREGGRERGSEREREKEREREREREILAMRGRLFNMSIRVDCLRVYTSPGESVDVSNKRWRVGEREG